MASDNTPIIATFSHTALFTDIDDTFIDRAKRPGPLAAAKKVHKWAAATNTALIYVSGLTGPEVLQRVQTGEIPKPDAIIGAAGTEIWLQMAGKHTWEPDTHYTAFLSPINFNRPTTARRITAHMATLNAADPSLAIMFEPRAEEQPFKITLHFLATDSGAQIICDKFARQFPAFTVGFCKEIHYNATLPPNAKVQKYCLDIAVADKKTALAYLLQKFGITGGYKAGDSGNDTAMLLNPDPLLPIVVGGYKSELFDAVTPKLADSTAGPFHPLKDGRQIYIENGHRYAAQSILRAITLLSPGTPAG